MPHRWKDIEKNEETLKAEGYSLTSAGISNTIPEHTLGKPFGEIIKESPRRFIKGNWIISFDFRYDKKRAKERIEAAIEFLESAKENLNKNRLRPFYENCFACAELLTEAILMLFIDKTQLDSHRSRIEKMQNWASLGNVRKDFSNTLKKLESLRSSVRYMSSTEFKKEEPVEYLRVIEEMIGFSKKSIE